MCWFFTNSDGTKAGWVQPNPNPQLDRHNFSPWKKQLQKKDGILVENFINISQEMLNTTAIDIMQKMAAAN